MRESLSLFREQLPIPSFWSEVFPYSERLWKQIIGIPSLEYRHEWADMVQVFKLLNDLEDYDPAALFILNDQITQGHVFKFYKRRCRTSKNVTFF